MKIGTIIEKDNRLGVVVIYNKYQIKEEDREQIIFAWEDKLDDDFFTIKITEVEGSLKLDGYKVVDYEKKFSDWYKNYVYEENEVSYFHIEMFRDTINFKKLKRKIKLKRL